MLMELSGEQQDRIQRLLEQELREAVRAAAAQGVRPGDVAALVADRRRALAELRADLADDPEDPLDDAGEGDGIAEPGR